MSEFKKTRLKYICHSFNSNITTDILNDEEKYPVYGASGVMGYLSNYHLGDDYLGIIKDGAGIGRIDLYPSYSSLLGTMAYILPNKGIDIMWLKYCIESLDLSVSLDKTTIPHIYFSEYGNRTVFCPDLNNQQIIANFLNKKCSEIEGIYFDIEKQIETLEEYKQTIIAEAVTKGLDFEVEMKDSGIDWNPIIPKHWNPINPKALFKQRKDRARAGERQLTASQKNGIMYQDEYMEREGVRVVVVQKDFNILKHVEPNDFVISMRSFQGGLEYSELTGCISSAYIMLIPNLEKVHAPFYKWFFKSSKYINAIQSTSNLVRDGQAMRYANFAQIHLFDIPMNEQIAIADYLDKKCFEIDELIKDKKEQLEVLEQYKKSLIYEYVTGKKTVTEEE